MKQSVWQGTEIFGNSLIISCHIFLYGVIVNSIGTTLSFKEQKNEYSYVSLWY